MATATQPPKRVYRELELNKIDPPDVELREHVDQESLAELSETIKDRDILNPVIVTTRPRKSRYTLIAGGRRIQAARTAGKTTTPAFIYDDVPGNEALEIALIENIQRDNLEPMWEARAIRILQTEHGYTEEQVAAKLRKNVQHVRNRLRLLGLPLDIQKDVEEKRIPVTTALAVSAVKGEQAQRAMIARTKEAELPYPVVQRMVQEVDAEGRRQRRQERERKKQAKQERASRRAATVSQTTSTTTPPSRPAPRPISPTAKPQPSRQKPPQRPTLPTAQQDKTLQHVTLKCEQLVNLLDGVDLSRCDKQHLRNLRGVVHSCQRGLQNFISQAGRYMDD